MINRVVDYYITCDKCREPLEYKDGHVLTSHVGHVMKESNREHIIEVSQDYGWTSSEGVHICDKCSSSSNKEGVEFCGTCKGEGWIDYDMTTEPCNACGGKQPETKLGTQMERLS